MDNPHITLLPCPFCGSDRITVWGIRDGQQAICKDCKSLGSPVFHGLKGREYTRNEAAEAWNRRFSCEGTSLADENARLREALKPSGDTKAAYIGEFQFSEEIFDGETETYITVKRTVPWTTVKEIMAAISARAALTAQDGGKTVSPEIGGDHG